MRLKALLLLCLFSVVGMVFCGCVSNNNASSKNTELEAELKAELAAQAEVISQLTAEKEALEDKVAQLQAQLSDKSGTQSSASLLITALEVVGLLQDLDMQGLSEYVHPNKGVRFSPYGHVLLQEDLVFFAQDIPTLLQDSQLYTWGAFDGTGDPINYTFSDYYDRFIYDVDFADPHMIGNNFVIGAGNTLINLEQAYPDGSFVEFYFTGFNPDYVGMDWRSLRLVFEEWEGTWSLVGIVHDEWTI